MCTVCDFFVNSHRITRRYSSTESNADEVVQFGVLFGILVILRICKALVNSIGIV